MVEVRQAVRLRQMVETGRQSFTDVRALEAEGYMKKLDGHYVLTRKGMAALRQVMEEN